MIFFFLKKPQNNTILFLKNPPQTKNRFEQNFISTCHRVDPQIILDFVTMANKEAC